MEMANLRNRIFLTSCAYLIFANIVLVIPCIADDVKYFSRFHSDNFYRFDLIDAFDFEIDPKEHPEGFPYYRVEFEGGRILNAVRILDDKILMKMSFDYFGRVVTREENDNLCKLKYTDQKKKVICYAKNGNLIYTDIYLFKKNLMIKYLNYGATGQLRRYAIFDHKKWVQNTFNDRGELLESIGMIRPGK